jgi:hypothetical protein
MSYTKRHVFVIGGMITMGQTFTLLKGRTLTTTYPKQTRFLVVFEKQPRDYSVGGGCNASDIIPDAYKIERIRGDVRDGTRSPSVVSCHKRWHSTME